MTAADLVRASREVVVGWWGRARMIRRFRPIHIHVLNEYQSLYKLPVLLSSRNTLVYRLGDAPARPLWFSNVLWSWLVAPSMDRFVCISEFVRREAVAARVAPEKYSYPRERSAPEVPSSAAPSDGTTVAYVGQLSEEKDVGLLVEAALALDQARDDVPFSLAGDYPWQNPFAERLIRQFEEVGCLDRITLLGYVEDIPGLLECADPHVCPSVWEEPLSNVVRGAEVPSSASPSGRLPELIEHGVDGFVCRAKATEARRKGIESSLNSNPDTRPASSVVQFFSPAARHYQASIQGRMERGL